jgi:hypothetical protein
MKKIPLSIQNAITSSLTIIEDLVYEMDIVFKDENKIFSKIERKISIEKMKKIRENIEEIKKILQKLKRN